MEKEDKRPEWVRVLKEAVLGTEEGDEKSEKK